MNEQENKFAALTEQELQEINGGWGYPIGGGATIGPTVHNGAPGVKVKIPLDNK